MSAVGPRRPMRAPLGVLALLAVGMSGCEPRALPSPDGNSVTVLYGGDIGVFGPVQDDSPKFLLYLPLVNYEGGSSCGEPTPALAERWEHSPDYREWTVWLREGIRWHDGVPVTAACELSGRRVPRDVPRCAQRYKISHSIELSGKLPSALICA